MRHAWVTWFSIDYLFPILALLAAVLLASDSRSVGHRSDSRAVAATQQVQVDQELIAAGN